jgi:hypothetical protein
MSGGGSCRADVKKILLFHAVLHKGGMRAKIEVVSPNGNRNLLEIYQGKTRPASIGCCGRSPAWFAKLGRASSYREKKIIEENV